MPKYVFFKTIQLISETSFNIIKKEQEILIKLNRSYTRLFKLQMINT